MLILTLKTGMKVHIGDIATVHVCDPLIWCDSCRKNQEVCCRHCGEVLSAHGLRMRAGFEADRSVQIVRDDAQVKVPKK